MQMIREVEFHENVDIVDFGLVVQRDGGDTGGANGSSGPAASMVR